MEKSIEQRVCLRFCAANGIICTDAFKMLEKSFGDSIMSKSRAFQWYRAFKEGREVVDDLPRPGRPTSSTNEENVEQVKKLVLENRRYSLREMAKELNISHESIRMILCDVLGMRRIASRLVPRDLNLFQKEQRNQVADDMIERVNLDATFIERIITGDETWIFECDSTTSQSASECRSSNEPKSKKPRRNLPKNKVMLTIFFDIRGIIHFEFLPEGRTMDKHYYLDVMKRLRDEICKKRPDLWKENSWILHHENAASHNSIVVSEFLNRNATNRIEQPPFSPDLAPCDFFLFPKLKLALRKTIFKSIEEIEQKTTKELKAIPKKSFEKCMNDWIVRWKKCVASEGDYFEGDSINLDD